MTLQQLRYFLETARRGSFTAAAAAGRLRIGHPMGVMAVNVQAEPSNAEGGVRFSSLGFSRTARRIMDGYVYVPREGL